jgi:hypothetical protein
MLLSFVPCILESIHPFIFIVTLYNCHVSLRQTNFELRSEHFNELAENTLSVVKFIGCRFLTENIQVSPCQLYGGQNIVHQIVRLSLAIIASLMI